MNYKTKIHKSFSYLMTVVQRKMLLGCNSKGPQQAVKAKKLQFKPGIYSSPFLSALLIGPSSIHWKNIHLAGYCWKEIFYMCSSSSFCLDNSIVLLLLPPQDKNRIIEYLVKRSFSDSNLKISWLWRNGKIILLYTFFFKPILSFIN